MQQYVYPMKHSCGMLYELLKEKSDEKTFISFFSFDSARPLGFCPQCGKELKEVDFTPVDQKEN